MKYTRKKGGKFLGKGSYGCTFAKPPLKCKQETTRKNNSFLSKVFVDTNAALFEEEISSYWKEIDPSQEFTVYTESSCNLDTENIRETNEFTKCTFDFPKDKIKPLLFSKYAGTDLHKLKPISNNYLNIFKSFIPLLEGLQKAHDADLVHCDIKEENIVAEVNDDNIKLRFIDLGLSMKVKDMVKIPEVYLNKISYYYWPFEFCCINMFGKLEPYDIIEENYNYLQNVEKKRRLPIQYISAYPVDINELYDVYRSYNFKDFSQLFKKLDVYSFGIMLSKLIFKYFRIFFHEETNKKVYMAYYINSTIIPKDVFFNSIKNDEQKAWHLNVLNKILLPLFGMLDDLASYDPTFRMSAKEIANIFKELLPEIEIYLQPEKVKMGYAGLNVLHNEFTMPMPSSPEKKRQKTE